MGHTEPLVLSHRSMVAFSKVRPEARAVTGSFITWPLMAHKNSCPCQVFQSRATFDALETVGQYNASRHEPLMWESGQYDRVVTLKNMKDRERQLRHLGNGGIRCWFGHFLSSGHELGGTLHCKTHGYFQSAPSISAGFIFVEKCAIDTDRLDSVGSSRLRAILMLSLLCLPLEAPRDGRSPNSRREEEDEDDPPPPLAPPPLLFDSCFCNGTQK